MTNDVKQEGRKRPIDPEERERYCAAFLQWYEIVCKRDEARIADETRSEDERAMYRRELSALHDVHLMIVKSSLLARMIYDGEDVRREPCPRHNGRWTGCYLPSECVCEGTGWLPNEDTIYQESITLNADKSVTIHRIPFSVRAPLLPHAVEKSAPLVEDRSQ